MSRKPTTPAAPREPQPVAFVEALGTRYLSYALSTITARSLPDVRDGLKPVHRRLLFAMRALRLAPNQAPKKSARVVGDVIGRFHPHGDQAVYDALVRLAQDFAARYPLVDGQGNFGNIDGDNAAAMRYTEARLTAVAEALLDGIDEDAVDFRPTYDGEGLEPVVLPAAFPNLLANGAQGIAVGMATAIPPHNVGELCGALRLLIEDPSADDDALLAHVKGPDFPTGGLLVESAEAMAEAYRTGRGSFRLRARWDKVETGRGQYEIVITEIPYQVAKAKLVEKIADLIHARKLPLLADVRDESTDDVRLVLEPKSRNVDADQLMEHMFRLTELEVRVPLNLNVLDADGVPGVMNLREALRAFLDHRHVVLVRRSRHRLGKIDHRLEVLDGYLIAFLDLDEVIRIIREEDEPKQELMRTFELTEVQADAILDMRLRNLRKLEEMELKREHERLTAEKVDLEDLLGDEGRRWAKIDEEIADIDRQFGGATELGRRRTALGAAPSAVVVPIDSLIEREPVTVFLSAKGWIRTVKGHQTDTADVRYKEGDSERFVLHAETTDKLILFASDGRAYTLGVDKLPRGRGFGEPVRLLIDLGAEVEPIALLRHDPAGRLLVAASDGRGFLVRETEMIGQTRAGKQVLTPGKGARAAHCVAAAAGDGVAALSAGLSRRMLVFALDEVPEMTRGRGVILQRLRDGELADIAVFERAAGLSWGRRTLGEEDLMPYLGKRAQTGRAVPKGLPKANRFAG
ncbi:MAG: DNA topoisomerase IV subunit A [Azospirillaceae bacterium]